MESSRRYRVRGSQVRPPRDTAWLGASNKISFRRTTENQVEIDPGRHVRER